MARLLIIPAAGAGSRLGGDLPKILVPVAGRPILDRLLELYKPIADWVIVVAHPTFSGRLVGPYEVVEQPARTGMLDAVLLGADAVSRHQPDEVWVTWGDQVGVLPSTVARLADAMAAGDAPAAALPIVRRADPYIHFDRGPDGRISALRQRREGDVMPPTGESDMGLFALTREAFERDLHEFSRTVTPARETGERNFVPFVPWLARRAHVVTIPCTDEREAIGINTLEELQAMEQWLAGRTA